MALVQKNQSRAIEATKQRLSIRRFLDAIRKHQFTLLQGLWTYIMAVWLVFVGFVVHDVAPIEVDLSWCHQLLSELRIPWLQAALRRVRSQNLNAIEAAKKDDPVREGPEAKARRSEEQRPVSTSSELHQAETTDQV